eukprot:7532704-Alexandrium_andersonii.AAC.1
MVCKVIYRAQMRGARGWHIGKPLGRAMAFAGLGRSCLPPCIDRVGYPGPLFVGDAQRPFGRDD